MAERRGKKGGIHPPLPTTPQKRFLLLHQPIPSIPQVERLSVNIQSPQKIKPEALCTEKEVMPRDFFALRRANFGLLSWPGLFSAVCVPPQDKSMVGTAWLEPTLLRQTTLQLYTEAW